MAVGQDLNGKRRDSKRRISQVDIHRRATRDNGGTTALNFDDSIEGHESPCAARPPTMAASLGDILSARQLRSDE